MNKGKYYITTAIAYTSKVPHIGNTYEAVLADAIARFRRLEGYDVYFLTGTDEHGQKIEQQAKEMGVTPKEHVDRIAGEIRRIWDRMDVRYDQFIRTTDPKHERVVQKIFKKLYEQGDIYKSAYEGLYCVPCESFFTPSQAPDGLCPDCGAKLEKAKEEAYFLRLSKYAERLERHILENPDFIQPESRKNEMLNNFIRPGLQDLCVSRTSFKWGIPVDFDEGHVIYVWIDALSNYITAMGYDPDGSGELYNKYWPADVHLIGKDILRFHTIYWPVILMALGEPLPRQVFGHPWMLFGADKMSKSKGNVIYAEDLVRHFGVDAVRYYVLHEMPFAQDGSITWETVIARINSDLANILGNLVNRTVAMCGKYYDGVVPPRGPAGDYDGELTAMAEAVRARAASCMDGLRVADCLDEIWALLRRSNKYIDETTPWILAKNEEDRPRLGTVLYNLLECIRIAAVLIGSFLPGTADRILAQLGNPVRSWESAAAFGGMEPGTKLGEAQPLFARIDEQAKLKELTAEFAPKEEPAKEYAPPAPEITIDDFGKVDLRVAKILECEPVPKADKLLRLTVDLGFEKRQIVSGIAKWYKPADLIGKKVVVVSNLKPAMLRGVESRGMLLAGDQSENDVRVLFVENGLDEGSKIR